MQLRPATLAATLALLALLGASPAGAALPSTSSPELRLERTIRTTPFAGTSTSTSDGEGTAFVPRDFSLWLVGDNRGSMYEVHPYTGALKRTIPRSAFDAARQLGGGALAGRERTGDFESLAYDESRDELYAISGTCCTSASLPTAFRLTRDRETHRFVVESYQPLPLESDFTAAAWNPRDGKLYVAKGRYLRAYDYATNTLGSPFTVSGVQGITGMDFSATGADLLVVNHAERLFRIDWSTRKVVGGWNLDLTPFGVADSRAVEVIPSSRDRSIDQLYVLDGYDGRPAGDPLRYAVFVFDVVAAGGGGGTGGNLVGNPSFESGTTGWTGSGVATLSRAPGGHDGVSEARLDNLSGAAGTCTLNDSPNWVGSTVRGTYTGAMWVRADQAGAVFKLRFREYLGSTLVGTPVVTTTELTTSWQRVAVSIEVREPGHTLDLQAFVPNAPTGPCFAADEVSITVAP